MKSAKLSLTSAAVAFGVSRETVRRALAAVGIKTGDGETFTIKQIHNALAGDIRGQRARLLKAQAYATEIRNRKAEGELVNAEELKDTYAAEFIYPFRNALFKLANEKGFSADLEKLMAEFRQTHEKTASAS